MQRKTILAFILVIAAIIFAMVVWKWTFKKSDVSMASKKADVEIEADFLTHEFESNEDEANAKYLDKVIVVSGIISTLHEDDQNFSVYLKKEGDISGVMCTFNKSSIDTTRIKIGDHIRIKGFCDGYLMDVKLNKCSLDK